MKRYPHTGVVTSKIVTVTAGEFASSASTTSTIEGRLEVLQPNNSPAKVKNSSGDWVDAKGRFFTLTKAIANADTITVNSIVYSIVAWVDYQTSSEIWLD